MSCCRGPFGVCNNYGHCRQLDGGEVSSQQVIFMQSESSSKTFPQPASKPGAAELKGLSPGGGFAEVLELCLGLFERGPGVSVILRTQLPLEAQSESVTPK